MDTKMMSGLQQLPSVDSLLQTQPALEYQARYGRPLTLQAVRQVLREIRSNHSQDAVIPDQSEILSMVEDNLSSWTAPTLQKVINASGVILHTNLGRAPLSRSAINAIQETANGYSTLEYDLNKGRRGSRSMHAGGLLKQLTGAEDALVVNNNASAVLLILAGLAKRRKVAIARSQLVEIGGGFRIPDVMKTSGAILYEIGTTNRVHLHDYQEAIENESIRLVMRAHRSNFQISGFTSEPGLEEIVMVAHHAGIPTADDLGSGTLIDTSEYGLGHEPMIQESLAAGAELVCFSGDKLLGGPQAGIILGRAKLVSKLKKHPLARAVRADKLCLAALSATLIHYIKSEHETKIPIWRMISAQPDDLRHRAIKWIEELGEGELLEGQSTIGGGSLPGETLPTWLAAFRARSPDRILADLRKSSPAIIARIENDQIICDPRTVLAEQEEQLIANLRGALKQDA
jgi:L-seryl-tRNA(Ser) seleniumtransferase